MRDARVLFIILKGSPMRSPSCTELVQRPGRTGAVPVQQRPPAVTPRPSRLGCWLCCSCGRSVTRTAAVGATICWRAPKSAHRGAF